VVINYNQNNPLWNSLILGLCYIVLCSTSAYFDNSKVLFAFLMLFAPGIIFPMCTVYLKENKITVSELRHIIHFLISLGLYHGCVWLYSGENQYRFSPILAATLGSLLFCLATKYLLKFNLKLKFVFSVMGISGFVFIPYVLVDKSFWNLGFGLCFWTIANGAIINSVVKLNKK
jgi:hypothetical protein